MGWCMIWLVFRQDRLSTELGVGLWQLCYPSSSCSLIPDISRTCIGMHHLWQARLSLPCLAWVFVLVHAVFVLVNVVFVLVQGVLVLVHGVFILVHGGFVLVQGVFVLVHEVFVWVHGVFVLVHGVFGLLHGVFVLVHGVLSLRFRNTRQLCPITKTSLFLFSVVVWS